MKLAALTAIALIGSGFSPIALPNLVGVAAAQPVPNVLLCTDTSLLGPPGNGHFWGSPYILPTHNAVIGAVDLAGPIVGGGEMYSGMAAVSLDAVIQRCPVMNRAGKPTDKYQDVVLRASHRTTFVIDCAHTTGETVPPPYLSCQLSHLPGGSPDDR